MSKYAQLDVLIVEDEPHLAELHRCFIENNFNLRVIGIAATLGQARSLLERYKPRLILLDNFLPDGLGMDLIRQLGVNEDQCSVIFITAASEMQVCGQAMRAGAFDYIIKPISLQRLRNSIEHFMRLTETLRYTAKVNQNELDTLFHLPGGSSTAEAQEPLARGIEANTVERIQVFFRENSQKSWSVDEVLEHIGVSKTTTRRYLEYFVKIGFLTVEMQYGKVGHPRRLYHLAQK
ncbi:MAG: response regulator [Pantoea sp.]|uniref:response regulator n=1 Tax=Pantoea sp. TaxID=69393 RepID=UPI0039E23C90